MEGGLSVQFSFVGMKKQKNMLFKAMLNCLAVQFHGNAWICILLSHDKRVACWLLIYASTELALMSLHTPQHYNETH